MIKLARILMTPFWFIENTGWRMTHYPKGVTFREKALFYVLTVICGIIGVIGFVSLIPIIFLVIAYLTDGFVH